MVVYRRSRYWKDKNLIEKYEINIYKHYVVCVSIYLQQNLFKSLPAKQKKLHIFSQIPAPHFNFPIIMGEGRTCHKGERHVKEDDHRGYKYLSGNKLFR